MSKQATTAVSVTNKTSLIQRMGNTYGVDGGKLYETLKETAFKGGASDAQMMALMIVADQYGLNPFCREIFAFPDSKNGIVPVVGVDGWARIINAHPQFDGMEFDQDEESCTCTIYRKDRSHPVTTTEYLSECKRNTGPWTSHPKRMLRHKAMIQSARLAFGYAGIYDKDEAERIIEASADWAPIPMPKAITVASVETAHEQTPAQPAPADIAQPTREDLVVAIGQMLDAAKASKVDKAMKAVGIAWQDGESWEQASDETLAKLAAALK